MKKEKNWGRCTSLSDNKHRSGVKRGGESRGKLRIADNAGGDRPRGKAKRGKRGVMQTFRYRYDALSLD